MQKAILSLALFALLITAFSMPDIFAETQAQTYVTNNSTNISKNLGSPTYNQILINTHNFIYANEQGRNASSLMQKSEQEQRDFFHNYWITHPFATNETASSIVMAKLTVAKSNMLLMNDLQKRNWYDIQTSMDKADILKNVQKYLANGRNSAPAFVSCEAWHACNEKTYNPVVSSGLQYEDLTNSTK